MVGGASWWADRWAQLVGAVGGRAPSVAEAARVGHGETSKASGAHLGGLVSRFL